MTKLVLTERDQELIEFLATVRECPFTLLAERFFKTNPFTGALNRNPESACQTRLKALKRNGFLAVDVVIGGKKRTTRVVRPGNAADSLLGSRASRRCIPPREQEHHIRTLDALRIVEVNAAKSGERVLSFQVEATIRAETQSGRRTTRGDTFDSFPDAVCVIGGTGSRPRAATRRVALEYVTSKYTDKDIAAKHASFRDNYDAVMWFADTPRTCRRVMNITGGACTLLN